MRSTAASPVAPRSARDLAARLLEAGVVAAVVIAPIPFGSVPAGARTALELGALVLLAGWTVRALTRPTPLPSRGALWSAGGLLVLAALQIAPLGAGFVSLVSPRATEVRDAVRPAGSRLAAETELLGVDPTGLDAPATLSVEPQATASALRTGTALVALFLVATTVGALCGARRLAFGLLVAAAFQGLYGILMLSSDAPRLLHRPKQHYLDCATGTFVNRNHFASYLAMALACGLALLLWKAARVRRSTGGGRAAWAGPEAGKVLLLALAVIVGLAGLLTSFSRAGIAVGVVALGLTAVAGSGAGRLRTRVAVALLVTTAALLPLLQVGSERLVDRYSASARNLVSDGGRARVWMDSVHMAGAFPVVGTGLGSFAAAYPVFRSPGVRFFYAHAHNDLVQLAAESGVVGTVLVLALLVSVLRTVVRGLSGEFGVLGGGLAAGFVAVLLHSLVDFDFHIPANAATAVVLAGALEGLAWKASSST